MLLFVITSILITYQTVLLKLEFDIDNDRF